MVAKQLKTPMTYDQFSEWVKDKAERYELIDGVPYMMAGTRFRHDIVASNLMFALRHVLKGTPCQAYLGGIDFRTDDRFGDQTAVRPDLYVLCQDKKIGLNDSHFKGGPDIAVEILSPSSMKRDKIDKFNKYLQAGVQEYWIIDPVGKIVDVHTLENGKYVTQCYTLGNKIKLIIVDGVALDVNDIFEGLEVE